VKKEKKEVGLKKRVEAMKSYCCADESKKNVIEG